MATFAGAVIQIVLLDLVFSIDSILTAVGMTDELPIMVAAVVLAVTMMLILTQIAAGRDAHKLIARATNQLARYKFRTGHQSMLA